MKRNLIAGDRVALSAKFLKNTGQFTGPAGARRGTFIKYEGDFARVHWDDIEEYIAAGRGDYAEPDYCAEVRANGSMVHAGNLAKVNSAAFALNDI